LRRTRAARDLPNAGEKRMVGSSKGDVMNTYDDIAHEFKEARREAWHSIKEIGNPAGMTILDLGAGSGRNAIALAEAGAANVVAADISIRMLEMLRFEDTHAEIIMPVQCDAMELPFKEGAFDAVVCVAMVHHIAGRNRRGMRGRAQSLRLEEASW